MPRIQCCYKEEYNVLIYFFRIKRNAGYNFLENNLDFEKHCKHETQCIFTVIDVLFIEKNGFIEGTLFHITFRTIEN